MRNLSAGERHAEADAHSSAQADTSDAGVDTTRMAARARWLMIISGLTTMVAIAAVIGVIGYRVFRAGGTGGATPVEGTIMLPKSARIVATAVVGERIVVTLDIGGATEIRTFDIKTLKEAGRITFAAEP